MAHEHQCASCDRLIISPHAQCPYCLLHRPLPQAVVPPAPVVPHQPAPVHPPGPPMAAPVAAMPLPPLPAQRPVAAPAPVHAAAPVVPPPAANLAPQAQVRQPLNDLIGTLDQVVAMVLSVVDLRLPEPAALQPQAPAAVQALPALGPLLQGAVAAPWKAKNQALLDSDQVHLRSVHAVLDALAHLVPGLAQRVLMVPAQALRADGLGNTDVARRVMDANELVFRMLQVVAKPEMQAELPYEQARLAAIVQRLQVDVQELRTAAAALP